MQDTSAEVVSPGSRGLLSVDVRGAIRGGRRIGLHPTTTGSLLAVLDAAEEARAQLVLFQRHFTAGEVDDLAEQLAVDVLIREAEGGSTVEHRSAPAGDKDSSWLGLFTSGTSGRPKVVTHDWERLRAPSGFVGGRLAGARWLLAYSPTSFAGLQVCLAALASGGVVVHATGSFAEIGRAIVRHEIDVISATPTYWRMLVASWPAGLERPCLRQATFGGEYATQQTLDLVREAFRPRRMTTIYASTEVGTAIVVSDGVEGFPAEWLDDGARATRLRIRDGRLEVRSPYRMRGYLGADPPAAGEEWFRTPDLMEVRGGRVVFAGREDLVVNVGGAKVMVEQVERAMLGLPQVLDCRIHARRNPVTGHVLAADVLLRPGCAASAAELKAALRGVLAAHAIPQLIRFVDVLEVASSGKKHR
jgi:acyl-coenzyme A synthetase/AMP-(fatty) acid ligase